MYVLGVMGLGGNNSHDGAAAILRDGKLLAAAEEERFVRKKHAPDLSPVEATRFCLNYAGLKLEDIDAVAYGWNPETSTVLTRPAAGRDDWADIMFPRERFPTEAIPPLYFVKHHLSHIAGAFYSSGFSDAACICVDGQGENESITLAYASGGKIEILREFDRIYSLGALYEAGAHFCGLGYGVPGKLMGLAPYGTPRHTIPLTFDEATGEMHNGLPGMEVGRCRFGAVCTAFENHFAAAMYPYKPGAADEAMSYVHVAATVQQTVESVILGMARYLRRITGSKNLVLCGGVALNCTCNGVVERSAAFENVFVPPGANDASCSIGAAYEVFRLHGYFDHVTPPQMDDARLGPAHDDDEIIAAFAERGFTPTKFTEPELCAHVAAALHGGAIALWFQGRAEFGPRALGARSILASPCRRENHYRVNRLKQREVWRPLAPSILEHRYRDFYEGGPTSPAAFMLKADRTRDDVLARVPAVLHVDLSARPQVVREAVNARYFRLIAAFEQLSGVPIVMNTSLNRRGEPIANSPRDALEVFLAAPDADLVVIGDYVWHRSTPPATSP